MSVSDTQSSALRIEDCVNALCPWSGDPVSPDALTIWNTPDGQTVVVGFCNPGCRDKFEAATTVFADAAKGR